MAAKLVPLPAESAGYLLLGIADQLVKAPLPLDERGILLSPEGNLSLLALTSTSRTANVDEGLLERQLRAMLGRLLAHTAGSAPALSAVARRAPQGGILALIRELEAALIPVNRSAGRRSLARLQRETDRVRYKLAALTQPEVPDAPAAPGSAARVRAASPAVEPARPVKRAPEPAREAPQAAAPREARRERPRVVATEPPAGVSMIPSLFPPSTAQVPSLLPQGVVPVAAAPVPAAPEAAPVAAAPVAEAPGLTMEAGDQTEMRAPVYMEAPDESVAPLEVTWGEEGESTVPPAVARGRGEETLARFEIAAPSPPRAEPSPVARVEEESPASRAETAPLPALGRRPATVEQLMERFAPSDGLTEREINRMLKQAVGVELSALPPGVETLSPPRVVTPETLMPAPEVIPVMPLSLPPLDPQPPRRPRAAMAVAMGLLLLGLGVTLALWARAPGFFSGHLP